MLFIFLFFVFPCTNDYYSVMAIFRRNAYLCLTLASVENVSFLAAVDLSWYNLTNIFKLNRLEAELGPRGFFCRRAKKLQKCVLALMQQGDSGIHFSG